MDGWMWGRDICTGLTFHGGNKGDCLHVPWLILPRCPWNAPVEIYNFIIGCPSPMRKCLGVLALSKKRCILAFLQFEFQTSFAIRRNKKNTSWSSWFFPKRGGWGPFYSFPRWLLSISNQTGHQFVSLNPPQTYFISICSMRTRVNRVGLLH